MFVLAVLTALTEIAAFGLGIAGMLQRRRKRMFALLGMACSVVVLAAIDSLVGFVKLASGVVTMLTETEPRVHGVSSE